MIPSFFRGRLLPVCLASLWLGFGQWDLRADPAQSSLIVVEVGDLPIVLSAPHGGRRAIPGVPERAGTGVAQFQTVRDSSTDELAAQMADDLARLLGARPAVVIAQFARTYVDANRPPEGAYENAAAKPYYDAYQRAVLAACQKVKDDWGAGLLVDVHGQSAKVDTIFRGTADGQTVRHLKKTFGEEAITGPQSLLGELARRGYKIFPENGSAVPENPHFDGGYIVRTYGSRDGGTIDAIQLESGLNYRKPDRLAQTARDYAAAIAVFAKAYLPKTKIVRQRPPAP